MEQKNNTLSLILVVVLVLSFVSNFVGSIPILLFSVGETQFFHIYYPFFVIINIIVSPVLVFVVFYFIGKNFDLKNNLKSSIIRLLFGSYIGHFLGSNISQFVSQSWDIWSTLIGSLVSLGFIYTFFTAFSALAITYLKQNNHSVIQT